MINLLFEKCPICDNDLQLGPTTGTYFCSNNFIKNNGTGHKISTKNDERNTIYIIFYENFVNCLSLDFIVNDDSSIVTYIKSGSQIIKLPIKEYSSFEEYVNYINETCLKFEKLKLFI